MNQEKIGKFIALKRKKLKFTQGEVAEKLGVTEKSVSNWENGRNMPDLSLFKPLCEVLNITINELLSGEELAKEDYQERLEENIVNTIDYSTKKINKYSQIISLFIIIFGLFIAMSAIMIFPSESSWGSIYSVFGIVIFTIGISRLTKDLKIYKRTLIILAIFIGAMGVLLFTDYLNVKLNNEPPMFRTIATTINETIYYDTPFYDVFRCNKNTKEEYYVITKNKNYSELDIMYFCEKN